MHHELYHLSPEERRARMNELIAARTPLPDEELLAALELPPEPDAPLADNMTYKQRLAIANNNL